MNSGDEAIVLSRHQDVRALLYDPRFERQLSNEGAARINDDEDGGLFGADVSIAYGEGHQRWRRLVNRYFTARRILLMRPEIERLAEGFADQMAQTGSPLDLNAEFSFPLPVWVIGMLLGVPEEDRGRFGYWGNAMLNVSRFSPEEAHRAGTEFFEYLKAHVARLTADPGDDLISQLTTVASSGDGRLSELELVTTAQGLLVAGHEATSNMISKMTAMLLADRSRWEGLLADRSLVRSAVEESLRYDVNPGFGIPRYVHEDVELSSGTLPAGSTVICNIGSANRDEGAFPEPDRMSLDRLTNPHVTFGGGHLSCLGQSLARVELQTALEVLLRRFPTLELDVGIDELRVSEGLLVGGLEKLPVRW